MYFFPGESSTREGDMSGTEFDIKSNISVLIGGDNNGRNVRHDVQCVGLLRLLNPSPTDRVHFFVIKKGKKHPLGSGQNEKERRLILFLFFFFFFLFFSFFFFLSFFHEGEHVMHEYVRRHRQHMPSDGQAQTQFYHPMSNDESQCLQEELHQRV